MLTPPAAASLLQFWGDDGYIKIHRGGNDW